MSYRYGSWTNKQKSRNIYFGGGRAGRAGNSFGTNNKSHKANCGKSSYNALNGDSL